MLRFISAGAAQGLVATLARDAGIEVSGRFGAVGVMLELLLAGEPCDVVILTRAQVDRLEGEGRVVRGSARDLGSAPTSIAVRAGEPRPDVSDAGALRRALLAADAIYFPDPAKATAGIHFAKVLHHLGIADSVRERLRTFPNGTTAMGAMAQAAGRPIGCTQATEILSVPGVSLVAPLPTGYDLATLYTAAVSSTAANRDAAAAFVERLGSPERQDIRKRAGFAA